MAENGERLKVQANPAKSFFVSMLIKDITLRDAIGDLVDNAVDAIKACVEDKNDLSKNGGTGTCFTNNRSQQ